MTLLFRSVSLKLAALTPVRIVLLAVLGLMLTGLGGCVSMDEHKRLLAAYDQSQRQLAEAENDLRAARGQIAELNKKVADLTDQLRLASSGAEGLRTLQARLDELQKRYDELLKMTSTPVLPVGINTMLKDLAAQYPDYLEFDEKLGMVRMKSDLTFDPGSTEVSARGKQVLAMLAQILIRPEIERNEIQVVGHTDDMPINPGGSLAQRSPDNWTLSTNRAWSVLNVLRTSGIKPDRGMAGGWGEQRPVAPNDPGRRGNVKNRRVEIFIRPSTVPEGIIISTPGAGAPRTPATRPATPPTPAPGGVPLPR